MPDPSTASLGEFSTATSRPPQRPAELDPILTTIERYNPEHIPLLEDHLKRQCAESFYDFYANVTLLKAYQLQHERASTQAIRLILAKALGKPDFRVVLFLVRGDDESRVAEEFSDLTELQETLESCDFAEFWALVNDAEDIPEGLGDELSAMPYFRDEVRRDILNLVAQSYTSIRADTLASYLDLDPPQLKEYLSDQPQWKLNSAGTHVTVQTEGNSTSNFSKVGNADDISSMALFERVSKVLL